MRGLLSPPAPTLKRARPAYMSSGVEVKIGGLLILPSTITVYRSFRNRFINCL